jgi:hypothetical protein
MIENWKSADLNQVIGGTVISKEMMAEIQGGKGYSNTLSGECNRSGKSCWKIVRSIVNNVFDLFD